MAGTRVTIDLYFKDKTPAQVKSQFPQLLTSIKAAKAKASRINEGKENEEMTVKAVYHICHHDDPEPRPLCDEEKEI